MASPRHWADEATRDGDDIDRRCSPARQPAAKSQGSSRQPPRVFIKLVERVSADACLGEVELLALCGQHDNIVHVVEVRETSDGLIAVHMEECEDGDLHDEMMRQNEEAAKLEDCRVGMCRSFVVATMSQVVDALEHIHNIGIVHCDLKPENILYERASKRVRLIDFGSGRLMSGGAKFVAASGTLAYASPERLCRSPQGTEVDLWAFGVIVFELVFGQLPWDSDHVEDSVWKICTQPLPSFRDLLRKNKTVHSYQEAALAYDLCQELLDKNPETRLVDLDRVREHPYFTL